MLLNKQSNENSYESFCGKKTGEVGLKSRADEITIQNKNEKVKKHVLLNSEEETKVNILLINGVSVLENRKDGSIYIYRRTLKKIIIKMRKSKKKMPVF